MTEEERRKFIYDEKCMVHALNARVIYKTRSRFQEIIIAENDCYGKMLVLDSTIQFSQKDEVIFHEMLSYPVLSLGKIKKALVLGGGDGYIAEILSKRKIKTTVVELDEDVVNICKRFFKKSKEAFSSSYVELVIVDALKYKSDESFDVVFVDLIDYYDNPSLYSVSSLKKFKRFNSRYFVFHSDYLVFPKVISKIEKVFKYYIVFSAYIPSYASLWTFIIASDKPIDRKKIFSTRLKGQYFDKTRLWEYSSSLPFKFKEYIAYSE